jgi:hypothetical protein
MDMNFSTVAGELNETSSIANAFANGTTPSSYENNQLPATVFGVLRYVIGGTGVITNSFVIIVIIGFMEVKAKVWFYVDCWYCVETYR